MVAVGIGASGRYEVQMGTSNPWERFTNYLHDSIKA